MTIATARLRLTPRTDDWDDLTELLEDLGQYVDGGPPTLYPVVQAIAEGRPAELRVSDERVGEFAEHMAEFDIDVERIRG